MMSYWIAPSQMAHPEILNDYLIPGAAWHDTFGKLFGNALGGWMREGLFFWCKAVTVGMRARCRLQKCPVNVGVMVDLNCVQILHAHGFVQRMQEWCTWCESLASSL